LSEHERWTVVTRGGGRFINKTREEELSERLAVSVVAIFFFSLPTLFPKWRKNDLVTHLRSTVLLIENARVVKVVLRRYVWCVVCVGLGAKRGRE
jgi:hypothetical protein